MRIFAGESQVVKSQPPPRNEGSYAFGDGEFRTAEMGEPEVGYDYIEGPVLERE